MYKFRNMESKYVKKYLVLIAAINALPFGEILAGNDQKKSPNVVFVFADQLREQALGYTGDPNVMTPNIDRLAGDL